MTDGGGDLEQVWAEEGGLMRRLEGARLNGLRTAERKKRKDGGNVRRKEGKGGFGEGRKRGRRHMGMNKFILMKPD